MKRKSHKGGGATRSLRDCLEFLEHEAPDEVRRIGRTIDPKEGQHAALEEALAASGRFPWLIFESALTLDGGQWAGLFASSISTSMRRMAMVCGIDTRSQTPFELIRGLHAATHAPAAPEAVGAGPVPVQAVVLDGDAGPLDRLPCWRNCEQDSRPGWFTPIWLTKDPDSGRYNLSWHRSQVVDARTLTIRFYPPRHAHATHRKLAARHEPMPAVAILGHHPAFGLAAATRFGLDVDELNATAGVYERLTGSRLRMAPSRTWGEDFLVPADAEAVLEGYIDFAQTVEAGPWSDAWRYYAPRVAMPVVDVRSVTLRERPLIEGIQPRSHLYDTIAYCSLAYENAYRHYPGIRNINIPHLQTMIVAYDASSPGETINLGLSFFQVGGSYAKHVILVDGSIDPYNLEEVAYALATRVDANRRVHIIPTRTSPNDPSARGPVGGGLLIDATTPLGEDFPAEGRPSREAMTAMRSVYEEIASGLLPRPRLGW